MAVGKLYIHELSPPCRAVMITGKALGIELELIVINLMKGAHLTPEFLKLNPAHSIPAYVDNDGTCMADSHAIMAYLVGKYGKDDCLYPKDLAIRAAIDQRLHFDSGSVYSKHIMIVAPMWWRQNQNGISSTLLTALQETYNILNNFLEGNKWVSKTNCPTIADFSLGTSIMGINIVAPFDASKCENITAWLKRLNEIPYFKEVNHKGQVLYEKVLKRLIKNDYAVIDEL